MSSTTVAVTGGNGKLGQAILAKLNDHDYRTVNIARGKRREEESDLYLTTDLLDAGEVYGSLAKANAKSVIHMGTIPDPYNHQDFRVYESNVMSGMHVLEAAESLNIESVCLASSINAIGSEHQERPVDVRYLPVDENHPQTPDDSYGIAKHALEVTADGYGRRPSTNMTISSLRYPWVTNVEEMREFFLKRDRSLPALHDVHPATGQDVLFSYLAIEDAADIARRAVEASHECHEIFWAVAEDTTAEVPTADLIAEFYPEAETRADFTSHGHESLFDLSKASTMLNWQPEHSWRDLS